jgi:hypothetical protein
MGRQIASRVEVASLYLEQLDENDIGIGLADRYGIPRFETVGEAMAVGKTGVQVDGVVIIAEHGDYENNEFGQKLYPRRRMVDAAIASMVSAGKFVPIMDDKHLAWNFRDAKSTYDNSRRLGIPLLAGSTIPLSWRVPTGAEWPLDASMSEIVVVGFGPTEIYGHHNLEGLQAIAERHRGGESGVVSVRALSGVAARSAIDDGTINRALLHQAMDALALDPLHKEQALRDVSGVFLVEYTDGLKAAVVSCGRHVQSWGIAASGPGIEFACKIWLQPEPFGHALFLVRQIESLFLNRSEPYPVERTLLSTGMLDALMHSLHDGGNVRQTPELVISYRAVERIAGTGIHLPLPEPGQVVPN